MGGGERTDGEEPAVGAPPRDGRAGPSALASCSACRGRDESWAALRRSIMRVMSLGVMTPGQGRHHDPGDAGARRVACPYQQGQPDENHAEQQAGQRAGGGNLRFGGRARPSGCPAAPAHVSSCGASHNSLPRSREPGPRLCGLLVLPPRNPGAQRRRSRLPAQLLASRARRDATSEGASGSSSCLSVAPRSAWPATNAPSMAASAKRASWPVTGLRGSSPNAAAICARSRSSACSRTRRTTACISASPAAGGCAAKTISSRRQRPRPCPGRPARAHAQAPNALTTVCLPHPR